MVGINLTASLQKNLWKGGTINEKKKVEGKVS